MPKKKPTTEKRTVIIKNASIVMDRFAVDKFIEALENVFETYAGKDWHYKFDVEG
jgi:hypothetical protein